MLYLFNTDKHLLNERGSFIIRFDLTLTNTSFIWSTPICRQLCVLLNAEDIYLTLGTILLNETNLKFASLMVDHLNMILLTSSELFELRNRLKDLSIEVWDFFKWPGDGQLNCWFAMMRLINKKWLIIKMTLFIGKPTVICLYLQDLVPQSCGYSIFVSAYPKLQSRMWPHQVVVSFKSVAKFRNCGFTFWGLILFHKNN